jgi:TRAP-type uncharacterized transport system substrate-binding protein
MPVRLRTLCRLLAALAVPAIPCAAQNHRATSDVARLAPQGAPTARAPGEQTKASKLNNWTLAIAGGFFEGTFIRFAVELGKALDDGENLRILPIVSYGGNENVNDLLYLKGVDLAITYTDTLDLYKKSGQIKDIEERVNYISQLLTGELYIYGRPEIASLQDLDGKKVSLGTKGSSATTTGPIVFGRLGIHPDFVYVNNSIALEKMKTGEIAAIVSTGGKPNDLFVKLQPEPGFHFVPIEFSRKFADYYLPCPLSHDDYPQLIPVDQRVETLCMSAVLAVYNFPRTSDRFRRVERFVQYYFERFERLKQPGFHPKWKEVSLTADVPGWNRYWIAEEALAALPKVPGETSGGQGKRGHAATTGPLDLRDRDVLLQEFFEWKQNRAKTR